MRPVFRYADGAVRRDYGIGSCAIMTRDQAEQREKLREARHRGIDPIAARRELAIDFEVDL